MTKVYDLFMFNGELDILEIRLNILGPFVDFFVIGDAAETFSGKPKPLYLRDNMDRFAKWKDKIIPIDIPRTMEFNNAFERAAYQKELLKRNLPYLGVKDDDIIYYGDVDEVWDPNPQKVLESLNAIYRGQVVSLEMKNYCYYLNNRSSERWVGTIKGKWSSIKEKELAYWRANHTHEMKNAGWHFTNMGGSDMIRRKLEDYDHQEFNIDQIKNDLDMKIKFDEDYVGRAVDWEGKPFQFWIDESELPSYIISNKSKLHDYFKS